MPFIRGRYHINAIAGEALEAAREAEAALLALEHDAEQAGGDADAEDDDLGSEAAAEKGPIHRVQIETAALQGAFDVAAGVAGGTVDALLGRGRSH